MRLARGSHRAPIDPQERVGVAAPLAPASSRPPVAMHCRETSSAWQSGASLQLQGMPQISRFFGIVIAMYHDDHHPPHFHARYAGDEIQVGIADGRVNGKFPQRAKALVLECGAFTGTNWKRTGK